MTGLVILTTGVWSERVPTEIVLSSGDISYLMEDENGAISPSTPPQRLEVLEGIPQVNSGDSILAWHGVRVEEFFEDYNQEQPFTRAIHPVRQQAVSSQGTTHQQLYGMAVENGAPLTALAFRKGLSPLGSWGGLIVLVSVLLFATSTAISWSYYGDCCANYLFGPSAVLPYKILYVLMHFTGAIFALSTVWTLGDVALGLVTFPNLIALILLSGVVARLTRDYFTRKPWRRQSQ